MQGDWESGARVVRAERATTCASTVGLGSCRRAPLSVSQSVRTPSFLLVMPEIRLSSYFLLGGEENSLPLALLTLAFEQEEIP